MAEIIVHVRIIEIYLRRLIKGIIVFEDAVGFTLNDFSKHGILNNTICLAIIKLLKRRQFTFEWLRRYHSADTDVRNEFPFWKKNFYDAMTPERHDQRLAREPSAKIFLDAIAQ